MRHKYYVPEEYDRIELFAGCTRRQLRSVSRVITRLDVPAGKVLATQGKLRHEFVILVAGSAAVWRDGRELERLGAGDHLGEFTVLRSLACPATVVAETPMTVDVVAEAEFRTVFDALDQTRARIERELDRRVETWIGAGLSVAVPELRVAVAS